jgi:hypothetical protein
LRKNSFRLAWIGSVFAGIYSYVGSVRAVLRGDTVGIIIFCIAALLFLVKAWRFYMYSKTCDLVIPE